MPTVKYKCPDTGKPMSKTFPYNAMGKAQADSFAKTMKGSMNILTVIERKVWIV